MVLFIPIALFSLLFIPFLGLLPYHDGNLQFLFSYNLYHGTYLTHWIPFHPPFSLFLTSIFFSLFGLNSISFVGYVVGVAGIIAMYFLTEKLFNKKAALVSSVFLSISGLFLSVGLFALDDFILASLIIIALCFYVRGQIILYSIAASLAVLTKETALLLPICILFVEFKNKKILIQNILPFLCFVGWIMFLRITGHALWNDWNFSGTPQYGTSGTILYNLVTFHFLNKYAYENWLHLFILNFNWAFWILALLGLRTLKITKQIFIIFLFIVLYTIAILSFQTYTITRYVLPVFVLVYIFCGYAIVSFPKLLSYIITGCIVVIAAVSLLLSVDPVSNLIWQKTYSFGYPFYAGQTDGPDGITYNMEYFFISRKRNDIIKSNTCGQYPGEDLHIVPQMFGILGVKNCLPKQ